MAKQNFLKGGYVGKLGETIGQRWKDKRVIRTYSKPRNPRTPKQQAMRANFALANKLAQQAMLINGGQGIWDTTKSPEYSLRVGQAMRMLQAGVPPDQAIPLYPVAPEQKAAVKIISAVDSGNDSLLVTLTGYKSLPIATLKGTALFLDIIGDEPFDRQTIEFDFDTATGQFEILYQSIYPADENGFYAVGLDLTAYDAQGTEIPTAKIEWAYYEPDTVCIFPLENFQQNLDITGQLIQIQQGNATAIRIDSIDPEELNGTLFFYGYTYDADTNDSLETSTGSTLIDRDNLPIEINTYIQDSADTNGYYGAFWYLYQRGNSVFCSASFVDLPK